MSSTTQTSGEGSSKKRPPIRNNSMDGANDAYFIESENDNDQDEASGSDDAVMPLPSLTGTQTSTRPPCPTTPRFKPRVFIITFNDNGNGKRAIFRSSVIARNPKTITLDTLIYESFRREVETQLEATLEGKRAFSNGLDECGDCGVDEGDGLYPANNGTQWRAALQMYHDLKKKRCEFVVMEDAVVEDDNVVPEIVVEKKGWGGYASYMLMTIMILLMFVLVVHGVMLERENDMPLRSWNDGMA